MFVDTSSRSNEPEIMDDFNMKGETLRDALDKIAAINRLLGGNKVTLQGVELLLAKLDKAKKIRSLDVGCGNGDMLRFLADYASKNGYNFSLTGIDANDFTISYAKSQSLNYSNISFQCADIFEEINKPNDYDIILCTLTLHHFKDQEILDLLRGFKSSCTLGIVINDLQRSAIAYYLFIALCWVFRLNKMSRDDGLVSILRGFKKADLKHYAGKLNLTQYLICWKWAFRYQWIIKNTPQRSQT